ncbi:MAG: hypothetical protein AAGC68_04970 [Verrucomicrobiota bacterium]
MRAVRTFFASKIVAGIIGGAILTSVEADSPVRVEDALASDSEIAVFGSYRVQGDKRLSIVSTKSGIETDSSFIAVEVTPWLYLKEHSRKDFLYQERYKVYVHDSFVDGLAEWEENGEERLFVWAIEDSLWTHHLGYPLWLEHAGEELNTQVEAVMIAVEAGKRHGPLSLDEVREDLNVQTKIENGEATVTVTNHSEASVWQAQLDADELGNETPRIAHACDGIDPEETSFAGEDEFWRELQGRRYYSAVFADIAEHLAAFSGYPKNLDASTAVEVAPGESVSFAGVHPFPFESAKKKHEKVQRIRFQVPIFASDELLNPLPVDSNEEEADRLR